MTTYTKTLSVVANVGGAMTQQGWGDQQWGSAFGGVSGYPALLLKNSFVRTLLVQAVAVITPSRHSIFGKLLAVTGTSVVSVVRKVKVTLSVTAIASLITRKTVDHIFGKITVTGTPDLVKRALLLNRPDGLREPLRRSARVLHRDEVECQALPRALH